MTKFFIDLKETEPVFETDGAYSGFHLTIADNAGNVVEVVLSYGARDRLIRLLGEIGQLAKIL